jgi:hypothetical protein
VEAEQVDLGANGPKPVLGEGRGHRARDQIERACQLVDAGARLVRLGLEKPRGHVLGGGGPEIPGQERQRDTVGLGAVAALQVGGALRKRPPAREPCCERCGAVAAGRSG